MHYRALGTVVFLAAACANTTNNSEEAASKTAEEPDIPSGLLEFDGHALTYRGDSLDAFYARPTSTRLIGVAEAAAATTVETSADTEIVVDFDGVFIEETLSWDGRAGHWELGAEHDGAWVDVFLAPSSVDDGYLLTVEVLSQLNDGAQLVRFQGATAHEHLSDHELKLRETLASLGVPELRVEITEGQVQSHLEAYPAEVDFYDAFRLALDSFISDGGQPESLGELASNLADDHPCYAADAAVAATCLMNDEANALRLVVDPSMTPEWGESIDEYFVFSLSVDDAVALETAFWSLVNKTDADEVYNYGYNY